MCIALFSDIHGNIQALDVAVASYHLAHHSVDYDREEVIREMARVHTPAPPTSAGFCAANTRG